MVCKLILFNYRLLFYVFDNLSKDDLTSIPNLLHNLKGERHSKQRMPHTHIHVHIHITHYTPTYDKENTYIKTSSSYIPWLIFY